MTKMLTLFGEDISKLNRTEIRRELKVQKYLLRKIKKMHSAEVYKRDNNPIDTEAIEQYLYDLSIEYEWGNIPLNQYKQIVGTENAKIAAALSREDRIDFFETYINNLEALIAELEWYKDRRQEERKEYETAQQRYKRKIHLRKVKDNIMADSAKVHAWNKAVDRDGISMSWDREKFFLIANDRGYQTEGAVIYAIQNELGLDRPKAESIMRKGKFTWGQVLCLGAMLQMTPKEFCDTFLMGYFEEYFGEYRATYKNLDKEELLKHAIKPSHIK